MTIRTGCSSALVGLDEACQALANGHCSSAIVAGTNIIISPTMTQHMTQQGVLSAQGSCKTFDAAVDGYARGEAINAVYIKKLDDPIRAVIRSTFQNCDGKTAGLTNPSSQAHEDMMRTSYSRAQLPVSRTAYVECHGTGTAVGDPLETVAIGNVFGGSGVYIGSVSVLLLIVSMLL
jgi:acyl transferase domain-containing protein